jgi:DNA helicase HerA-like ATPase
MVTEFKVIDDLIISSNDRISIFGRTGSGKTFFVKNWLLPHYTNYIFWDVKHENRDIEHEVILNTPAELKDGITQYQKILYQPTNIKLDKDFDAICEIIFKNKNTALYVDEASKISIPNRINPWHNTIITQGRTYNVGIINASQRPRIIHNTLISESEHLFIFSLNLETDIIKIKQSIGDASDDIRFLPEHYVLYYNIRYNRAYIFKQVEMFDLIKREIKPLELYRPSLLEYMSIVERHRSRLKFYSEEENGNY